MAGKPCDNINKENSFAYTLPKFLFFLFHFIAFLVYLSANLFN